MKYYICYYLKEATVYYLVGFDKQLGNACWSDTKPEDFYFTCLRDALIALDHVTGTSGKPIILAIKEREQEPKSIQEMKDL